VLLPLLLPALLAAAPPGPCERFTALSAPPPGQADDATCLRLLDDACAGSVGRACAALADLLLSGVGTAPDPTRAERLLDRGCQAGHGESCFRLSSRTTDPGRRRLLLEEGCSERSGNACLALSELAEEPARRRGLLERACDLGAGRGCLGLSRLSPGRGGPKRLILLERGCALQDGAACAEAGDQRRAEAKEPLDLDLAADRYQRGCTLGAAPACARLGSALLRGEGVVRDPIRGRDLLLEHCGSLGPAPCLAAAADLPEGPAALLERSPGLPLLEALCEKGLAEGCHRAGRTWQEGLEVTGDGRRAERHYERACGAGQAAACHDLAVLLWAGGGVPADRPRATRLLGQACDGGVVEACLDLELHGLRKSPAGSPAR
jgi:TPR repeat protein